MRSDTFGHFMVLNARCGGEIGGGEDEGLVIYPLAALPV